MSDEQDQPGFFQKLLTNPLAWIAAAASAVAIYLFGGKAVEWFKEKQADPNTDKAAAKTPAQSADTINIDMPANAIGHGPGANIVALGPLAVAGKEITLNYGSRGLVTEYLRGHVDDSGTLFIETEHKATDEKGKIAFHSKYAPDDAPRYVITNGSIDLEQDNDGAVRFAPRDGKHYCNLYWKGRDATNLALEYDVRAKGQLSDDKKSMTVTELLVMSRTERNEASKTGGITNHMFEKMTIHPVTLPVKKDAEGAYRLADMAQAKTTFNKTLYWQSAFNFTSSYFDVPNQINVTDYRQNSQLNGKNVDIYYEIDDVTHKAKLTRMTIGESGLSNGQPKPPTHTLPIQGEIILTPSHKLGKVMHYGTREDFLHEGNCELLQQAIDKSISDAKAKGIDLGTASPQRAETVAPEIFAAAQQFRNETDKPLERDLKAALPATPAVRATQR